MKILILILLSFEAFTQVSTMAKVEEAFRQSQKNQQIKCLYFRPKSSAIVTPLTRTQLSQQKLQRNFKLEYNNELHYFSMAIGLDPLGQPRWDMNFDNGLSAGSSFNFSNSKDLSYFGRFFQATDGGFFLSESFVNSGNRDEFKRLGLQNIKCNLQFAHSKPVPLTNRQHISVHPHWIFDQQNKITPLIEDKSKQFNNNIALIQSYEAIGQQVNLEQFLKTGVYQLDDLHLSTTISLPVSTQFAISPVGYNDYTISQKVKKIDIFFTGGNHNYCMWNNIRSVLWAVFYEKNNVSQVNFHFNTEQIVVQRRGIYPGIGFNRVSMRSQNSVTLNEIFSKKPKLENPYHRSYSQYFDSDFIERFSGVYSQVEYNYRYKNLKIEKKFHGLGDKKLKVNFLYDEHSI